MANRNTSEPTTDPALSEVLLSSHLLTHLAIVYRQGEHIKNGEKVSEIDLDVTFFANGNDCSHWRLHGCIPAAVAAACTSHIDIDWVEATENAVGSSKR